MWSGRRAEIGGYIQPDPGSCCLTLDCYYAAVSVETGDTLTFTVTCPVLATATGNLVNTATVTPPGGVLDRSPASNTSTDTDEVLGPGACGYPETRNLTQRTVDTVEEFVACQTILAGEGFSVVTPRELTLGAEQGVALRDGFSVGAGGKLTLVVDGSLLPN